MNGSQKRVLAAFALFLVIATALMVIFKPEESPPALTHQAAGDIETAPTSQPIKESVVIPNDFEWTHQDEDWLEELVEKVDSPDRNPSKWEYEFDETIQPGESLVTDGWEVAEGVFQFTVVTPEKIIQDGETLYQISAEITEVDLDGNIEKTAAPRLMVKDQVNAIISMVDILPGNESDEPGNFTEERYMLYLTPESTADGIRLKGNASSRVD